MKLIWATVTAINLSPEDLAQAKTYECSCDLDDGSHGNAIVIRALCGAVEVGDRVLLNTTAVDLALGTGGKHFVVTRLRAGEVPQGIAFEDHAAHGGHIMKLRYTPLQRDVLCVEAQESPWHKTMERATDLDHMPVVCCGLHSQVPLVAAAIKARAPHLRVGYVMTDEAALPLDFSALIAASKEQGLIDVTVATGQAFGGDYDAINLHSGMLAACHIGGCDVLICAIGPGVAGTGTPFGHGGIAQGEAINAVGALQGMPIACLRMSFADERERHQVISHHTIEALETIALTPALIVVPFDEDEEHAALIAQKLDSLENNVGHQAIIMEEPVYDEAALKGINVTTMRRTYNQDPIFFEAAFAAGTVAAQVASEHES